MGGTPSSLIQIHKYSRNLFKYNTSKQGRWIIKNNKQTDTKVHYLMGKTFNTHIH